uniref:NADH-ubiquinone oxidoreductase chain 6 n=1 Tax=Megaporus rufipes TaxID=309250 RepID=A0A894K8I5_9DYTI|nr:NADH dehydrogenase subunit 6 [Megaporus rufipes]
MYLITISINFLMSMIFLFLNHPMSMGLILMIQTIMISLITSFYSYSFWFSYILFLIMVGGMLVLFMYMTSLASNEKFKFSSILTLSMMMFFMISIIMYLMMDKTMIYSMFKNSNLTENFNKITWFKNENMISLNMMFNKPNFINSILLMNYLFLTLIMVVKITKSNTGPLRQKF